jgi:hypothetical protein
VSTVSDSDLGDAVADRAEVVEDSLRGRFGMSPWLAQAIDLAQLAIGVALVVMTDGSVPGWSIKIIGLMLAATSLLETYNRVRGRYR